MARRKIYKEGKKGQIVSEKYADEHPDTTMAVAVSDKNKRIKDLKDMLDNQRAVVASLGHDRYETGFYNGLELALATLEEREPEYL